jgi:hypothetical protein
MDSIQVNVPITRKFCLDEMFYESKHAKILDPQLCGGTIILQFMQCSFEFGS